MYSFNGYLGTHSKLIHVLGWHFTTFLTPLVVCVQSLLSESQEALSFIVFIPDWRDPPTEALIRVESSR